MENLHKMSISGFTTNHKYENVFCLLTEIHGRQMESVLFAIYLLLLLLTSVFSINIQIFNKLILVFTITLYAMTLSVLGKIWGIFFYFFFGKYFTQFLESIEVPYNISMNKDVGLLLQSNAAIKIVKHQVVLY